MKGVDFAGSKLTSQLADKLIANGVQFVARYLGKQEWKSLTPSEVAVAKEKGLYLMSIYQDGKSSVLGGYRVGVEQATEAFMKAQSLSQPYGSAIYFAVDFDVTQSSQYDTIEQFLKGVKAVLKGKYLVGVYGEYSVIEEMAKRKAADCYWQTYAWSGGKRSTYANVYQYKNDVPFVGIMVDHNESYGNEGFWLGPAKNEDEGVSDDDMKRIENLEAKVKELESKLLEHTKIQDCPSWLKEDMKLAQELGIVSDPTGTLDFHRGVAVGMRIYKELVKRLDGGNCCYCKLD